MRTTISNSSTVTSADGTVIAFDREGSGPPVILVLGAFNARATGAPLAARLSATFTTINYDRRGRGDSTDTAPYSVDREIDDLAALIDMVGGSAAVFGYSSGAVLALRAAAYGLPITSLALYDAPHEIAGTTPDSWTAMADRIDALVAEGRRGDAVELYQTQAVGIPPEVVAQLRQAPFWPGLEAVAPTLAYDARVLATPAGLAETVATRTLVLYGELSPQPILTAAGPLAVALTHAELVMLPGQTHDLVPDVIAPVLEGFLNG